MKQADSNKSALLEQWYAAGLLTPEEYDAASMRLMEQQRSTADASGLFTLDSQARFRLHWFANMALGGLLLISKASTATIERELQRMEGNFSAEQEARRHQECVTAMLANANGALEQSIAALQDQKRVMENQKRDEGRRAAMQIRDLEGQLSEARTSVDNIQIQLKDVKKDRISAETAWINEKTDLTQKVTQLQDELKKLENDTSKAASEWALEEIRLTGILEEERAAANLARTELQESRNVVAQASRAWMMEKKELEKRYREGISAAQREATLAAQKEAEIRCQEQTKQLAAEADALRTALVLSKQR